MRFVAAFAVTLALAAAASFAHTPVAGPAGLSDSVSGLRVGDRFPIPPGDPRWRMENWPDPMSCTQVFGGSLPQGISMMVKDGRIARFEIFSSLAVVPTFEPSAPFGLRTGMSMAEAMARLPSGVIIEEHKYNWPGGYYVTWYDVLRRRAIRIQVADSRFVDVILWGEIDAVRRTEGCV